MSAWLAVVLLLAIAACTAVQTVRICYPHLSLWKSIEVVFNINLIVTTIIWAIRVG